MQQFHATLHKEGGYTGFYSICPELLPDFAHATVHTDFLDDSHSHTHLDIQALAYAISGADVDSDTHARTHTSTAKDSFFYMFFQKIRLGLLM